MPARTLLFMAPSMRQTTAPAARIPANSSGPLIEMNHLRQIIPPRAHQELARFSPSKGIAFNSQALVSMPCQPRAHPQEDLKRHRMHSIGSIEYRGLGIKRDIPTQPKLPRPRLHQIAHPTERISPDAVSRMRRGLRKQFVLVH